MPARVHPETAAKVFVALVAKFPTSSRVIVHAAPRVQVTPFTVADGFAKFAFGIPVGKSAIAIARNAGTEEVAKSAWVVVVSEPT